MPWSTTQLLGISVVNARHMLEVPEKLSPRHSIEVPSGLDPIPLGAPADAAGRRRIVFTMTTAPGAWDYDGRGLSVATEWRQGAAMPCWLQEVLAPEPIDIGPRILLVRGVPFYEASVPGTLAVLSDPARLYELAGRGGDGWSAFMAAPSFWPVWFKVEAARVMGMQPDGRRTGRQDGKSRVPLRTRGPGG